MRWYVRVEEVDLAESASETTGGGGGVGGESVGARAGADAEFHLDLACIAVTLDLEAHSIADGSFVQFPGQRPSRPEGASIQTAEDITDPEPRACGAGTRNHTRDPDARFVPRDRIGDPDEGAIFRRVFDPKNVAVAGDDSEIRGVGPGPGGKNS